MKGRVNNGVKGQALCHSITHMNDGVITLIDGFIICQIKEASWILYNPQRILNFLIAIFNFHF